MEDKEILLISGLQHFSFCRRQWALIHIEQQWIENGLTAEGRMIHKRVHDASSVDVRDGIITMRDMPVKSERLGISGCCDAVEFFQSDNGITLHGRQGQWDICPVEYKHGHQKSGDCDRLQVTAQAMCLEEMFSCKINEGLDQLSSPARGTWIEIYTGTGLLCSDHVVPREGDVD